MTDSIDTVMEKTRTRLCVDCAWYVPAGRVSYYSRCKAPQHPEHYETCVETGVPVPTYPRRSLDIEGHCGPRGKWFQPVCQGKGDEG